MYLFSITMRRLKDSNLRGSYLPTSFPEMPLQPLEQISIKNPIGEGNSLSWREIPAPTASIEVHVGLEPTISAVYCGVLTI